MSLHIETEYAQTLARIRTQKAKVEQRRNFIDTFTKEAVEAQKAHAEALANEERILAEFEAIAATQKKAVDDEREAVAKLIAEKNP